MTNLLKILISAVFISISAQSTSEDGYRLWLRYDRINDPLVLENYNRNITGLFIEGKSALTASAMNEIRTGLNGLLGREVPEVIKIRRDGIIVVGTPVSSGIIASLDLTGRLSDIGDEGYVIFTTEYRRKKIIVIAANTDTGLLYGTFRFLRMLQTHAEGANLLADALAPYGGIVMWRAFVYDNNVPDDRARQAYNEFVPLDDMFRENVIIQVKNGPIDFQPREPFHPLFGSMPLTNIMPEFQITQEYLGASVHLVFLAPLYEECLISDTWTNGKGTTVASIIDGTHRPKSITAMAGVSNIGDVRNWTSHPFGQSNWYAFGRIAWDPYISSSEIASEWIRMTFTSEPEVFKIVENIMLGSREAAVNYMTPLGLHHIMYAGHHYGPGPWVDRGRRDWTSVYYHNADTAGIGFDRTSSGSNAVEQYHPEISKIFEDISRCPENLLLWFHHVPWDYRMKSGNTLWEELCHKYHQGVDKVRWMQKEWEKTEQFIDPERFNKVKALLLKQERDAKIWRDGCLLYFQTFSGRPFPEGLERPEHDLNYYKNHRYTDIPGIR